MAPADRGRTAGRSPGAQAQGTQPRVVVVTGAASGIGRAASALFAGGGDQVIAVDNDPRVADVCDAQMRPAVADVSNAAAVASVIDLAVREFGGLDVICNVAGIQTPPASVLELDEADYRRINDVNALGVFLMMKHGLPKMVERRAGSVVNVASIGAFVGRVGRVAYAASKAAVVQLTRTAAIEMARSGIRVNAVCPGPTMTAIMQAAAVEQPQALASVSDMIPLGRVGQPEEIAAAIAFLASDQASFITGTTLVVDGGLLANMPGQAIPPAWTVPITDRHTPAGTKEPK